MDSGVNQGLFTIFVFFSVEINNTETEKQNESTSNFYDLFGV